MVGLGVLPLIVLALAVFRLTRFITDDSFPPMAWLRGWYERKAHGDWADLATCVWCASLWVAAGLLALATLGPQDVADAVCLVLALSGVAAILGEWTE